MTNQPCCTRLYPAHLYAFAISSSNQCHLRTPLSSTSSLHHHPPRIEPVRTACKTRSDEALKRSSAVERAFRILVTARVYRLLGILPDDQTTRVRHVTGNKRKCTYRTKFSSKRDAQRNVSVLPFRRNDVIHLPAVLHPVDHGCLDCRTHQ